MPDGFTLHQNYPNPFNSSTVISFGLEQPGDVQLKIFDLIGREVTTLVDRALPAGRHSYVWDGKTSDGSETASGVYFYRLTTAGAEKTEKMVYLK
jgi:flagellar hook assembly protein FlgD